MPGYLVDPIANATNVTVTPTGIVSATNVQDAVTQLSTSISSVEGIALLGL